jgi:NAD(P)-dependent dehydrogenase (short-subunit alcohol dehydrogenase family)
VDIQAPHWYDVPHQQVLVTGAGSGIGRAVAVELARQGIRVYAAGRRSEALRETAALAASLPGQVVEYPLDVRDANAVEKMFQRISFDGVVTGLVHAAATARLGTFLDNPAENFRKTVESALFGTANVLWHFGTSLRANDTGGAAVVVSSGTAAAGSAGISGSSAAKAGVESLMRSVAREWGSYGIRVNCVQPGLFPVEATTELWGDPELQAHQLDGIALKRYGRIPEIVGAFVFLLSDAASYMTGSTIRVDGGQGTGRWPIPEHRLPRADPVSPAAHE